MHVQYSPVGYSYRADNYCLDCLAQVVAPNYESVYIQDDGCNCTECVLDRIADDLKAAVDDRNRNVHPDDRHVNPMVEMVTQHYNRLAGDLIPNLPVSFDRYDESSFDMSQFPKAIPYFNDIHAECGPEAYGFTSADPEWREQYCGATCAKCHAVIDGTEYDDGEGHYETVCPTWLQRKENGFR